MNMLTRLYHFLGSIYFAIILIGTTAALVVAGTFIEAATQSHRSASLLTYSTPWFIALLCGFFLNILLSALRRWPFKPRHIPFLITHLGLLMIIGGVMVKTLWGVQGALIITEGSGSHDLIVDEIPALRVETKGPKQPKIAYVPLDSLDKEIVHGIAFEVVDHVDNSEALHIPWIIGNKVFIRGLDPIPLHSVVDTQLPPPDHVKFYADFSAPCCMWGLKTRNAESLIHNLYASHAQVKVSETATGEVLGEYPLQEILAKEVAVVSAGNTLCTIHGELDLGFFVEDGCRSPCLRVAFRTPGDEYLMEISLDGDTALLNKNLSTPYLGQLPLSLDILMPPLLAIIADEQTNTVIMFGSDPHGSVFSSVDDPQKLGRIYAYDDGFAGYTIQKNLPLLPFDASRAARENALHTSLTAMLDKASEAGAPLAPPLVLFREACEQAHAPFGASLVAFLADWDNQGSWLYPRDQPTAEPLQPVFQSLAAIWPKKDRDASRWATVLFDRYEPWLQKGMNPLELLRKEHWPLVDILAVEVGPDASSPGHAGDVLTALTQQIMHAADHLPPMEPSEGADNVAAEFSASLRAYEIHLATIAPEIDLTAAIKASHGENEPIVLEAPIRKRYMAKEPLTKIEDNIPAITVAAATVRGTELIPLTFDKRASGLCWACNGGDTMVRFQPMVYTIPYHLRLRQARQINYPNTSQPYSYEADLVVKDLRTGALVEKTVSMNHVHETDDGYRFYLSAMYPPEEGAMKTVQIVVNRDPAKYLLTYPGAIILSCGIVLLFWMRPYRKKDE